jgi:putative tricarboxylic transport membrane protein
VIQKSIKAAKGELVFTSFLFLAGFIILVDTAALQVPQNAEIVNAQAFPFAVGGLLVLLSIIQFISVYRGQLGKPEDIEAGEISAKPNWKALAIAGAGLVQYALLVNMLTFIPIGAILFFCVAYALGAKKILKTAIISLVVAGIVYVAFTQGLQIQLPSELNFNFSNEIVVEENW